MRDFEFLSPTKIVFGKGVENRAGAEIKSYGKRVLLHFGQGSVKASGLYGRVAQSLTQAGLEVWELPGVKPNPRLGLVRLGIELCRAQKIDFILALGGGSAIDSAKAIGIGVPYGGDVWDFFSGKAVPRQSLPTGSVLTIAAAGSEASPTSVITNETGWYKRPLGAFVMRPKVAFLNPELTFTLPAFQTACGAADIMAHVMERYFTREPDVDLTDRLCEAVLKTAIKNAPIALAKPGDYAARAELMWAGTIAHNDLLTTGREGDWACHAIEHELSGIFDVAHGAGLAVVFPAWMRHVYKSDLGRFAKFAVRVWNADHDFDRPERTALQGIERLQAFFGSMGLPADLKGLGADAGRIDEMAAKCSERGPIGRYAKLTGDDIAAILRACAP